MSARELIVLGTASQVPTRTRAQHGALLKWDDEAALFDRGGRAKVHLSASAGSADFLSR